MQYYVKSSETTNQLLSAFAITPTTDCLVEEFRIQISLTATRMNAYRCKKVLRERKRFHKTHGKEGEHEEGVCTYSLVIIDEGTCRVVQEGSRRFDGVEPPRTFLNHSAGTLIDDEC